MQGLPSRRHPHHLVTSPWAEWPRRGWRRARRVKSQADVQSGRMHLSPDRPAAGRRDTGLSPAPWFGSARRRTDIQFAAGSQRGQLRRSAAVMDLAARPRTAAGMPSSSGITCCAGTSAGRSPTRRWCIAAVAARAADPVRRPDGSAGPTPGRQGDAEWVTLDRLSGGRLILGAGLGSVPEEFAASGNPVICVDAPPGWTSRWKC